MSSLDWLEQYESAIGAGSSPSEVELGAPPPPPQLEHHELPLGFTPAPPTILKPARPRGRIAVLRSVSGGAGRTTLAGNLAFEIASLGRSVCLVDLDHQHPSLHRYFGIASPKAAVLAGVRFLEQGRFGTATIDDLKVRLLSKGVSVDLFAGVGLPENMVNLNLQSVEELLLQIATNYQYVVVDSAPGVATELSQALDACATETIWVTLPDAISMGRFIDAQQGIGATNPTAEQRLVVNRLRASVLGARPEWQLQQVLRDRTALQLASMIVEDQALDQAMLQGLPLRQVAARSKALAAVNQLAKRIA